MHACLRVTVGPVVSPLATLWTLAHKAPLCMEILQDGNPGVGHAFLQGIS